LSNYGPVNALEYSAQRLMIAADACRGVYCRSYGPALLPTNIRKWTVLSSPFKHKKSRTQWERRTFTRILAVECNTDQIATNFIKYIRETLNDQTMVSIKKTSLYPLEDIYTPPRFKLLEKEKIALLEPLKDEIEIDSRGVVSISLFPESKGGDYSLN